MITQEKYPSPKGEITIFRITNAKGASVCLSCLGAGIISVEVPDRDGNITNVALRYKNPADYIADGPCMGKIPGRYANRIAKGRFQLDGKTYQLAVNNGPNALHGGPDGFQNQIWESEILDDGVRFIYRSKDGEEHYPGNLTAVAEYRWNDSNELTLSLTAETDRLTVVNLTNHTYWNLRGADSGCVLDHVMRMRAGRYLPTDDTLIPLGQLEPVQGTPMDFTAGKRLGRDIKENFPALNFGKGYDSCWAIDDWQPGRMVENAVTLHDEVSGRTLSVSTDQPGVQIYTGNWLAGSPENLSGRPYADYEGVAIEAQGFPDAPNEPSFPSQMLCPGEKYRRTIRFSFGIR